MGLLEVFLNVEGHFKVKKVQRTVVSLPGILLAVFSTALPCNSVFAERRCPFLDLHRCCC